MEHEVLASPLARWSRLCVVRDKWYVITTEGSGLRRPRWWSPRDLVRFPLHYWWVRRYW